MKYLFFVAGLLMPVVGAASGMFTWDLLWAGSWEESRTLQNRSDIRLGITRQGLILRGQAIDRRTLDFKLENPFGDPGKAVTGASFGLYHKDTGSRLLYGVLDEWGLPARIRSPWIRSAPYAENHKPVIADLRTSASSTKEAEIYLYASSPRVDLFTQSILSNVSVRVFASAQMATETETAPAFAGGLETFFGKKCELLLEGFYTGRELPAKQVNSWFSDPPPLPSRDFRLGAGSLMFSMPDFSLSSDWAWSETFAYGNGVYGNIGLRYHPQSSRWSLSLAADGMGERYVGRDGTTPEGGLRTAVKVEWKGPRSNLFRVNTTARGPGLDQLERSSSGIYYRFPSPSNNAVVNFPVRISRVSFNTARNASDWGKISDTYDGTLGLSLRLPPMILPPALLPPSSRRNATRPRSYPLGITFSTSIKSLGSSVDAPSPYPFTPVNTAFDSSKTSAEFIWSPGIFQFRTRWSCTVYANKDDLWEGSLTAAVRFKHGRFSIRFTSPSFPEKWHYTLSWRLDKL